MNDETDLKPKQIRFCHEYLIDYNGQQAAVRAGYGEKSAAVQASRLLKNDKILSYIRAQQKEQLQRLTVNADWVTLQIVETIMKCMQIKPVMVWSTEKHTYVESGQYSFDSKGVLRGLELLGKRFGAFDKTAAGNIEKMADIRRAVFGDAGINKND